MGSLRDENKVYCISVHGPLGHNSACTAPYFGVSRGLEVQGFRVVRDVEA